MSALDEYTRLLERYHEMIRRPDWWDGRRDHLVAEMDRWWSRLTAHQRRQIEEVAARLYEEGLAGRFDPKSNEGCP